MLQALNENFDLLKRIRGFKDSRIRANQEDCSKSVIPACLPAVILEGPVEATHGESFLALFT